LIVCATVANEMFRKTNAEMILLSILFEFMKKVSYNIYLIATELKK